jgi:hypothetical protein
METITNHSSEARSILYDSTNQRQDIVKVFHRLRSSFRTITVGNPLTRLRSCQKIDAPSIEVLVDLIRIHINSSKHLRKNDIIFGTDYLSVSQYSRLVRSTLFLSHGESSLIISCPPRSIPRLPRLEQIFVARLIYARFNSDAAVRRSLLEDLRRKLRPRYSQSFSTSVSVPSLSVLPTILWVDLKEILTEI